MGSRPDSTDVFCGNHPARETTIFESRNFYVIPANTPLAPGHLLVIPKRHYPTFGAVPGGLEKEYTEIVEMLKRFVMDAYGKEAVAWENGGPRSGQSVHHAHLHIVPTDAAVPAVPQRNQALVAHDFGDVRRYWHSRSRETVRRLRVSSTSLGDMKTVLAQSRYRPAYQYMEFRGERRIIPIWSQDVTPMIAWRAEAWKIPTVMVDGHPRWVRSKNPAEVIRCANLFFEWQRNNAGKSLAA